jgi:hypothetical protein
MAIIEKTITIALPCDEVYTISQDYSVRYDWDPFPDRLEMRGGGDYAARIGGKVFVRSKLGMSMVVEFVQVNPPKNAAIKMISGPWYLAKFAGSWHFDSVSSQETRVRFRYVLLTRGFVFNLCLNKLAVTYFRYVTKQRLLGLRNYCEAQNRCFD